jgi:hypothetical protein
MNEFSRGTPRRPAMRFDNGFRDDPSDPSGTRLLPLREPTWRERASRASWGTQSLGGYVFKSDLKEALDAYRHFLNGNGANYTFDLPKYLSSDQSGREMLNNCKIIVKREAVRLLDRPTTMSMTSILFSMGSRDMRFPYPATENWQKAIGACPFWMWALISRTDRKVGKENKSYYTAQVTINVEDRYNFNPNNKDIKTGIPDSDNGVFEITGLATQFQQYGTHSFTITWAT